VILAELKGFEIFVQKGYQKARHKSVKKVEHKNFCD